MKSVIRKSGCKLSVSDSDLTREGDEAIIVDKNDCEIARIKVKDDSIQIETFERVDTITRGTQKRTKKQGRNVKVVALSGAFHPFSLGHLGMIQEAAKYGKVIIILNSDEWLIRNKSKSGIMEYEKRKLFLQSIPEVAKIIPAQDDDDTVCETLKYLTPDIFGNGGSRTEQNTPEKELCKKLDIEMLWDIGNNANNNDEKWKELYENFNKKLIEKEMENDFWKI